MKYVPSQPPEGINVSKEHPLKSFFILSTGTVASIFIILFVISLFADFIVSFIPVEYERALFENRNIGDLITDSKTETSDEIQQYLQTLVDSLHEQGGDKYNDHQFKVSLSPMPQPNAFAAPGGHIVVTYGLLRSVNSENGLAMVLAHEIGHHYERHPLRGLGRGLVMAFFLSAISGFEIGGYADKFVERTAFIGQLAYSRKQETDSDNIAIDLLQKKYGHAYGASEFFRYIKNSSENNSEPPIFLSTHPSTQERLSYLKKMERKNYGDKKNIPKNILEKLP
ncbi:MAG: M48 family metallopeptidase [Gammaproteobacteria bacterium]